MAELSPHLPTLIGAFLALFVSLVATGHVLRYARQELLDMPNSRSSHTTPTPTGGGLGFLIGFFAAAIGVAVVGALFSIPSLAVTDPMSLLFLCLPLALTGFIDDKRGLSRRLRYGVQLVTAAITVWWCGAPVLPAQPELLAPDAYGMAWTVLSWVLVGIAITAVVNFTNFMDGMDGFVGGMCTLVFGFCALWSGHTIWWFLAAALAGFLFWNWHPAKIFMGDVGSTPLGLFLCVAFLTQNRGHFPPVWQLSVLMPLLGDAAYTLLRRAIQGENIFAPHHSHIYQRLMRSGLKHSQVAAAYIVLTLVCGLLATFEKENGALAAFVLCMVALRTAEIRIRRKNVPFSPPSAPSDKT